MGFHVTCSKTDISNLFIEKSKQSIETFLLTKTHIIEKSIDLNTIYESNIEKIAIFSIVIAQCSVKAWIIFQSYELLK